jgi:hypothetical protein
MKHLGRGWLWVGLAFSILAAGNGYNVVSREKLYDQTHRVVSTSSLSASIIDLGWGLVLLGAAAASICVALLVAAHSARQLQRQPHLGV